MRVTGNRLIDMSSAATTKSQGQVADASAELASGMRVAKPSDDPAAWMAAQRATLRRTLTEGANAAVQVSRDRLDDADTALASISDAVAQARAFAVQGTSDTYNAEDRAALGLQVRALFQSALAAANTRSSDGEYMFAGTASLTAPFGANGAYTGDARARAVPTYEGGATAMATVAGSELTAAGGVDILPVMDRVATALATNDLTALNAGLGDLGTAVQQLAHLRSRSGVEMNVLDATKAAHGELVENLTTAISRHVESDTVRAASNLAKATQALEVSRAVSSHLISLLGSQST